MPVTVEMLAAQQAARDAARRHGLGVPANPDILFPQEYDQPGDNEMFQRFIWSLFGLNATDIAGLPKEYTGTKKPKNPVAPRPGSMGEEEYRRTMNQT
jgi:hypothetical protein